MVNIHKYEVDVSKISRKCICCGDEIKDIDFEYEDYFIVFRGFTPDCCCGFICWGCFQHRKSILKEYDKV